MKHIGSILFPGKSICKSWHISHRHLLHQVSRSIPLDTHPQRSEDDQAQKEHSSAASLPPVNVPVKINQREIPKTLTNLKPK